MPHKSHSIAFVGACTALAMVLSYVEILLPPLFPSIPGIKLGLPNMVIVFLLYRRGGVVAATASLLRIVLVSLLFGTTMTLLYSLAGGVLSLLCMIVLRRLNWLSTVGVSVAGGVTHNIGQVLMAIFLLNTTQLGYYLVVLTVTGTLAGVFVGLCGSFLIKRIPLKFN